MSTPASARRQVVVDELNQPDTSHDDSRRGLLDKLRIWKQLCTAELLNALERGRYDLKPNRRWLD